MKNYIHGSFLLLAADFQMIFWSFFRIFMGASIVQYNFVDWICWYLFYAVSCVIREYVNFDTCFTASFMIRDDITLSIVLIKYCIQHL